jgi:hypothetical protein
MMPLMHRAEIATGPQNSPDSWQQPWDPNPACHRQFAFYSLFYCNKFVLQALHSSAQSLGIELSTASLNAVSVHRLWSPLGWCLPCSAHPGNFMILS